MAENDTPDPVNATGNPICGRRVKHCRKCSYHFSKAEHELWNCPECGESRKCTQPGTGAGGACKRFHGGGAKVGIEHPNFIHGGRSKYTKRLLGILPAHYKDILDQIGPDVLDLTDVALVLKARFYDVVSRTDKGKSEESVRLALKHCEAMDATQRELTRLGEERKQALARQDTAAADRAQAEIEKQSAAWNSSWAAVKQALRQDLQDWQTWNNAVLLAEKTTKVVESQRKGLVQARLMMGIDRVEKMFSAMIEAVNAEIEDSALLGRLQTKFKTIALSGLGQDVKTIESSYEEQ